MYHVHMPSHTFYKFRTHVPNWVQYIWVCKNEYLWSLKYQFYTNKSVLYWFYVHYIEWYITIHHEVWKADTHVSKMCQLVHYIFSHALIANISFIIDYQFRSIEVKWCSIWYELRCLAISFYKYYKLVRWHWHMSSDIHCIIIIYFKLNYQLFYDLSRVLVSVWCNHCVQCIKLFA